MDGTVQTPGTSPAGFPPTLAKVVAPQLDLSPFTRDELWRLLRGVTAPGEADAEDLERLLASGGGRAARSTSPSPRGSTPSASMAGSSPSPTTSATTAARMDMRAVMAGVVGAAARLTSARRGGSRRGRARPLRLDGSVPPR